jgi:hypothetical protein
MPALGRTVFMGKWAGRIIQYFIYFLSDKQKIKFGRLLSRKGTPR